MKKLSELTLDELREISQTIEGEIEALQHTVQNLQSEIYCRERPESNKYHLDTNVDADYYLKN